MRSSALTVAAAMLIASIVASGCITFTVVSTTPRPDHYFANGLDIETQHVMLKGIYPLSSAPAFPLPGFTVGVDVWLGLNIAYGQEGAGDQAANRAVVVTGMPMNFDVLDAILAGKMDAAQYADWATPQLLEQIRADPNYAVAEQRLVDAWGTMQQTLSAEQIAAFRAGFKEHFGYVPTDFTHAEIQKLIPAIVHETVLSGGFPAMEKMLGAVRDITPANFRFTTGTWRVDQFVNAVRVLDAVHKSGDERLIAQAEGLVGRILQGNKGTFSVEDLNKVFADLAAMQLPNDIKPTFASFGNLGIGIFWFGVIFPGEQAFAYYKQIILPFPLAIPGFGVIPRITASVSTQIPPFDLTLTNMVLDPIALPVTLPLYRAPLAAVASSGKQITFSTVVFNLGFEPGQAVLSEKLPAGWKGAGLQGIVGVGGGSTCTGFPPSCTLNLPPLSYVVSSYTATVPQRSVAGVEVLSTHIDSFDIDAGKHPRDGLYGTTSYNNMNPVLTSLFGDLTPLIFNAQSIVVTKPLDVILVTEPEAADATGAALGAYAKANAARAGTPADGVEQGTPAEGAVADPTGTAATNVNSVLDALTTQVHQSRVDLLKLLKDGGDVGPATVPATGTDPQQTLSDSGATNGDPIAALDGFAATRVSTTPPGSQNGQWTRDALGRGARITEVSTAQELADVLGARVSAIAAAGQLSDPVQQVVAIADALPSTVMVTTASPGFGGSTVDFQTPSGPIPVPAEALVDVLNLLGVGLVQDAKGYASNPWLFSPASGVVVGTAAGTMRTSGHYGAHDATNVFALPSGAARTLAGLTVSPPFKATQTFDQTVAGVWKSTGTETGAADVAMSGASGAMGLTRASDPTADAARQHALDSAIAGVVLNYGDAILAASQVAASAKSHAQATDAAGVVADASAGRTLAQGAVGPKAVVLPAGTPAVGSFLLGYSQTLRVNVGAFSVPIVLETSGHADVIGSDVHALGWGAAVKQSAEAGSFAFAVSVPFGVQYAPIFS